MDIQPIHAGCGAEVIGVDLEHLSSAQAEELIRAHADYGVLVFRNQSLTPDAQLAAAEAFGPINVNRFFARVPENERVALVLKEPDQETNVGGGWHTDHSYDEVPAMGSMLYAVELPPIGGDTIFASMYAAYDALSDGLKETLEGLSAVHSSRHVFGRAGVRQAKPDPRYHSPDLATQDAVHPVIIRHPVSGRPALYVNPGFTLHLDGWTEQESRPLLDYLYQVATRPEHTYRHRWEPGTVAFWDNRCTWHYALNDYQGHRRLMHRVTIDGVALEAA